MREILIKRIKQSLMEHIGKSCMLAENIADDLIASGVVAPPCNVGDTVWHIIGGRIWDGTVCSITIKKSGTSICAGYLTEKKTLITHHDYDFGKDVFTTEAEAEQALKGGA